jgi:hypothetical protein
MLLTRSPYEMFLKVLWLKFACSALLHAKRLRLNKFSHWYGSGERRKEIQQDASYSPSGWKRHSMNRGSTQSDWKFVNESKLKQKYFMYTDVNKSYG